MKLTNKVLLPLPFVFLVSLFVIHGCSSNTSPPVPTNQDASGIYTGTGEGTFTGVNAGNKMTLAKMKGMVDGSRFIFFNDDTTDPKFNVLYDGQITSITKTDLVGTAKVYQGGNKISIDVKVTGTVNSRASVVLTLASKGDFQGGTVDGLFIKPTAIYDRAASNDRIFTDILNGIPKWKGVTLMAYANMVTTNFDVDVGGVSRFQTNNGGPIQCNHKGAITDNTKNIYTVTETITDGGGCTLIGTNYDGLISIVDGTGTDNEMWYAITNGAFSIYGVLGK